VPISRNASKKPAARGQRPLIGTLAGVIGDLFQPGIVSFNQRIVAIRRRRAASDDHVLSGFIDLQVNGAYGIDVMSASAQELLHVSHCLAHEGTTAWLPTAITAPLETIERVDAVVADAMAAQSEMERAGAGGSKAPIGAAILGMHLEGPFISPKRLGAHPPLNLLPQGESLERVMRLKTLKLLTIAPELEGALEAIRALSARGIAVSLGHSDATYEQAVAGVEAGARMFTHVFNAMPPLHHRAPGIVGAALSDNSQARVALIPDGVHLHPSICQIVERSRGWRGIVISTDRTALAGSDRPMQSLFGGLVKQTAIEGGAARLPDGTLAGSVITMLEGVRRMYPRSDLSRWSGTQAASFNPASVLGLSDRGKVALNMRADLIVLDRHLNLKAVFIGGREID
jgi:N-acetylglucosamine-6-phosphate deacetylase